MSEHAHVAIHDDRLHVTNWSTADPTVLAAARMVPEREDLGAWLARAVSIGAIAMADAGHAIDIDHVDATLERLERQLRASVESATHQLGDTVRRATDPDTGDVARAAQAAVDRLAHGVQRTLTGPGALLPDAAARALAQVTDTALAEINRVLDQDRRFLAKLVAEDRDRTAVELVSAVSAHQGELSALVTELKGILAAKSVREAREGSGPRKGLTYEAEVHLALTDIASTAGDGGADFTGSSPGLDGTRKGDVVVELRSVPGNTPRLVVEAKNRPSGRLTVTQWGEALDQALQARGAHVAIGVCPRDQLPGSSPVVVLDTRRMLLAWSPSDGSDLLAAAYLLMRMAAAQHHDGAAPSSDEVARHFQVMSAAMAGLEEIQRHAAATRRASDKIDAAAAKAFKDLAQRIETTATAASAA